MAQRAARAPATPRRRAARSRARAPRRRGARALRGLDAVAGRIPIAFLAGFASFVAPCVLPLVPGYLSAVSSIEARQLGRPGAARRVLVGSVPFVAGFTFVFVALGVLVSALVGHRRPARRSRRSPASCSSSSASRSRICCRCRSGRSRRACSSARATAARTCCSAARSPSARRRASARSSSRRSCSPADSSTVGAGSAAPASRTRSASRCRSSLDRARVRARDGIVPLAPRPLPLLRGRRRDRSSSRSGCCSSSTASGGCASAFDHFF